MLPADLAFIQDPNFKQYVELYAKDEQIWLDDFSAAFGKLLELGVKLSPNPASSKADSKTPAHSK